MKIKLIVLVVIIFIFFICIGLCRNSWHRYRQYYLGHIAHGEHGLRADYYRNTDWAGDPVLSRVERKIRFNNIHDIDLGKLEEDFLGGYFSISWHGLITIPCSGIYKFKLFSDDGSWLFLNGALIARNDGIHPAREVSARRYIRKGVYPIEVRYTQAWGEMVMALYWRPPRPFRKLGGRIPLILLRPVDSEFDRVIVDGLTRSARGWSFLVAVAFFVLILYIVNL